MLWETFPYITLFFSALLQCHFCISHSITNMCVIACFIKRYLNLPVLEIKKYSSSVDDSVLFEYIITQAQMFLLYLLNTWCLSFLRPIAKYFLKYGFIYIFEFLIILSMYPIHKINPRKWAHKHLNERKRLRISWAHQVWISMEIFYTFAHLISDYSIHQCSSNIIYI